MIDSLLFARNPSRIGDHFLQADLNEAARHRSW